METDITFETPLMIVHTVNDLLTRNGKVFSDITDVLYMYKNKAADLDGAALVTKNVAAGVTLNAADSTFDVSLLKTDYGVDKIEAGNKYLICISVEFNTSGIFIEDYDPKHERKVHVLYDKTRA